MKVKIKSYNGELPIYLTFGKIYDAKHRNEFSFVMRDDDGDYWICLINHCSLLNGGSWEIIEE